MSMKALSEIPNGKPYRVEPGLYTYRNHGIAKEETNGPEGGLRIYWSISGDLDGPDATSAHAHNPQLATLGAACDWLDAYLSGSVRKRQSIERRNAPRVWGK